MQAGDAGHTLSGGEMARLSGGYATRNVFSGRKPELFSGMGAAIWQTTAEPASLPRLREKAALASPGKPLPREGFGVASDAQVRAWSHGSRALSLCLCARVRAVCRWQHLSHDPRVPSCLVVVFHRASRLSRRFSPPHGNVPCCFYSPPFCYCP